MRKTAVINEFSVEAIKDVLQKLERFSHFKVSGLTAYQLEEIKGIDPSLYGAIAAYITEDRWMPLVGMWCDGSEADEYALIRNALYSVDYFKRNFNKTYRVFFSDSIHTDNFAQIVYRSGFDAAYVTEESGKYWLDCADDSRILVCGSGSIELSDANDLDNEAIADGEFTTVEQEIIGLFDGSLEIENVMQPIRFSEPNETEKMLLEAEKIAVSHAEDRQEEIKQAWISFFLGDDDAARKAAENICAGRRFACDFIRMDSDEVELEALKFAEDKSGEVIIRLREKCGREKTLFVMADGLNAGFRCEIIPYEIQTFRVNPSGFVIETMFDERTE